MTSFSRALHFILAQQRGKSARRVFDNPLSISAPGGDFKTAVYTPENPVRHPIIFLHGMSPLGIHDPRQIIAVRALAAAGFRIICPEIPSIKDLKITTESIGSFAGVAQAILDDARLCPSGRAAFFAPSFSGAICLKAAAMPALRDRITAVCALGSMAQVRGSMEYLFLSDEADTYARYIVLANYLPLVKKYRPLAAVFAALARDNWNESASKNPRLTGFTATHDAETILKKLSLPNRKRAAALKSDRSYRKEVFAELTPYMERELEAYDIVAVAGSIQAPTLLMHGISDNVIPPGESLRLAPHLARKRLVISPFLGHADSAVSLKLIADVWRLVAGFAYFFRHAAR
ncbi:MAG: alpha/beta hydrolase [Spirochaetes bacterium]|nr:alpha/beta hydrolase [Spirochaetota bacterium]